jgi:hypothetical protein
MGKLPKIPAKSKKPPVEEGDPTNLRFEISPGTEKLIGRFVAAWSDVELVIGLLVWAILNVDEDDGKIISAAVDASVKVTWVRAFAARHLELEDQREIAEILSKLDAIRESRNLIVHGQWCTMRDTGDPVAISLRLKTEYGGVLSETFPHQRLHDLIKDCYSAKATILAWARRTRSASQRDQP